MSYVKLPLMPSDGYKTTIPRSLIFNNLVGVGVPVVNDAVDDYYTYHPYKEIRGPPVAIIAAMERIFNVNYEMFPRTHNTVPDILPSPIIKDLDKPSSTTVECVAGSSQQMAAPLPARAIVLPRQPRSTTTSGASVSSQGERSSGMGSEPRGRVGERITSLQQLFGSSKKEMLIHYKELRRLLPASFLKDALIDFYLSFMEGKMDYYKTNRVIATASKALFLKLQIIYRHYSYNVHKAFDPSFEKYQLNEGKFYLIPLNMDSHWIFFIALNPFRLLKNMNDDYVLQWIPEWEAKEDMFFFPGYLRRPASEELVFLEVRNNEEKKADGLDSLEVRNKDEGADHEEKNAEGLDYFEVRNNADGTAHEERNHEVPMEHFPAKMDIPHPADYNLHEDLLEQLSLKKPRNTTPLVMKRKKKYKPKSLLRHLRILKET